MTSWTPDLSGRSGPRYKAIADALGDDVASGVLPPHTRVPTHRDLAFRLGVTVGTVTRAYSEAERRGLIGGEVGRGTFVRPTGRDRPRLEVPVLDWTTTAGPSIDLSKIVPPVPDVEAALGEAIQRLIGTGQLSQFMGYGNHPGLDHHRTAGAEWLNRQHRAKVAPETLVMTVGAQNGMVGALASVARPGDLVVTECLTYHGIKAAVATLGMELEPIAIDDHGLVPESLEQVCRRRSVRVLYTVPTLHNPTGSVQPPDRRAAIADLCRRHGVLILEDDVFGFLATEAPPPIQAIAPDITLYVTSVSKSIAAGLRVGYLVVPPPLVAKVEATMRSLQYSGPPLLAEITSRWIVDGTADKFAARQREEAHARQALAHSVLPPGSITSHPYAQHLWYHLPEPWRREEFVAAARERGVAVVSGSVFAVGRIASPHAVRVGLCMPRERDDVARGLRILAEVTSMHATVSFSIV